MTTILIVEDDQAIREIVADFLTAEGYTVLQADDGTKGIGLISTEHPDLVILDIMMPGLGGFHMLEMMRASDLWRDIPVIMESAVTNMGKKVETLLSGADDYLTKPFDLEELEARIISVLRRSKGTHYTAQ